MTAELVQRSPSQMKPGNRIGWQAAGTEWAGTVWSSGPVAGSLWAIPDGPYGSRKPVLLVWRHDGGQGCYEQAETAGPLPGAA